MDAAMYYEGASSGSGTGCPIHDCRGRDQRASSMLRRRLSVDSYHDCPDMSAYREAYRCGFYAGRRHKARKVFQHSHSVSCTADDCKNPSVSDRKTKSVGSLLETSVGAEVMAAAASTAAAAPRIRPSVLELYPNQNTSFNAFRRRYSRSFERISDYEDSHCERQGYGGSRSSSTRTYQRSTSEDFLREGSATVFPGRHESGGQGGRWANIRRGLSLLSLCTGDDDDDDDDDDLDEYRRSHPSKILRPPTRYFYQKGISGLPVKCPAKYAGLAY